MRKLLLISATLLTMLPLTGAAQGLFSTAIQVNDDAISGYEVQQRATLLRALGTPGNLETLAAEQLIDDRLRLQAAQSMGISVGPEQIDDGLAELASRADTTPEGLVAQLAAEGVAIETIHGFVRPGLVWREVVRGRFAGNAAVSEAEIDRALAQSGNGGGLRVLMSEIIMPARPEVPGEVEQAKQIADRVSKSTSQAEFSAAARNFSATASRDAGGRLPWTPLSQMPPILRPMLLALSINEVTEPIEIPGALALFQLRGIEETDAPAPEYAAIEYAQFLIPGGRTPDNLAEAARIAGTTDTCNDLYGVAQGLDPARLERTTLPPAQIPSDIGIALAKLDAGETSAQLTRNNGQTLVLLMLCGRTAALNEDASRDEVASRLRNQRLTSYADSYLAQLRADARITRP